jgi:hypothetical protein
MGLTRELQAIAFALNKTIAAGAHDAGGRRVRASKGDSKPCWTATTTSSAKLSALRARILEAQEACASGHCGFRAF